MSERPPSESDGRLDAFWRLVRLAGSAIAGSLPLGALSLVLALLVWVAISNEENPSVTRVISQELPVEQVNVPRSLLPTDVQPAKVSVTVSGPRNAVNDVRPEDVSARVDLSRADDELGGAREGIVERPVRVDVRRRGVRAEPRPESVRVTVERQERRTVPVCVDKIDVPPPGFSVEEPVTTEPAEATIAGPRRNIDAVECAAVGLRLTGLTVSVSSQIPLEARDAAGRAIGGVTVQPPAATVNARVRQELFSRQVVVDIRLAGRPAPGYSVASIRSDPPLATIVGPLEAVRGITSVPTEVIDIEGARSEIVRAVALQAPPGISSGDRRTVVTISLQAVRGPGSVGVTPRIANLGPNQTAVLSVATVAVSVSGALADLLALKPADVTVTLDAAGLGPGTYRLEPRVTAPPGISIDGVTPDRIEVVIGGPR